MKTDINVFSASTRLCETERIEDEHELHLVSLKENPIYLTRTSQGSKARPIDIPDWRGKTASEHAALGDFQIRVDEATM